MDEHHLHSTLSSSHPLADSHYYLVIRTAMHMKTALYRTLHHAGLGVTPEQWSVLSCLWHADGQHQSELATKTGRDKFTISRIVSLLEKKGLVTSRPDSRDKRRSNVFLSQNGRELQGPVTRIVEDFSEELFQGMTQEELNELRRILEHIVSNIHNRNA
jgi:DNA-binding MarR family transcriptional regulator